MPLIIAPQLPLTSEITPIYTIHSGPSGSNVVLCDYSNATLLHDITQYPSYDDPKAIQYTITLHIPTKHLNIADSTTPYIFTPVDNIDPINIQTTSYELAIHIYKQLLAKQDITPDSLRAELPEVFI